MYILRIAISFLYHSHSEWYLTIMNGQVRRKSLLSILKFLHQENEEDDLHMKMQIIFPVLSNPAGQMPKSFFFQNCLMDARLKAAGLCFSGISS